MLHTIRRNMAFFLVLCISMTWLVPLSGARAADYNPDTDRQETVEYEGYLVKLDTNGYQPEVLRLLMEQELLNYVAMDVKGSKENYPRVAGVAALEVNKIEESVEMLKGQKKVPYEFRTTVVKGLHTLEEFEQIGKWLEGADKYFLQSYQESENLLDSAAGFGAFSEQELEKMAEKARKYIARVEVRGVE